MSIRAQDTRGKESILSHRMCRYAPLLSTASPSTAKAARAWPLASSESADRLWQAQPSDHSSPNGNAASSASYCPGWHKACILAVLRLRPTAASSPEPLRTAGSPPPTLAPAPARARPRPAVMPQLPSAMPSKPEGMPEHLQVPDAATPAVFIHWMSSSFRGRSCTGKRVEGSSRCRRRPPRR